MPGASAQELRGLWVDAFAEGIKSPAQIDLLLRRAQAGGFNALFVQVRKSADAYYQSRYDPWASDNRQRFDGLEAMIEKAHALNPPIQVHAWMNACAVGRHRDNPYHVTLAHPDYVSLSVSGQDHDGEAKKIDPGHPDAADLTFRVALDIVRHYDVDGIQLDFIRYGGQRWGYSPTNVARFNARYGRTGKPVPKDPVWMQWRRDQVTALVRKIYAYCSRVKPKVIVSAATICWMEAPKSVNDWAFKSAAMTRTFQDWRSWMREGMIDLNCTMSYSNEQRHPDWFRGWAAFAKANQFNRRAAIGIGSWFNTLSGATNQILAARKPIAGKMPLGVVMYCYNEFLKGAPEASDRIEDELAPWQVFKAPSSRIPSPPFASSSTAPQLPWKQSRTTGHLMGTVLTADRLSRVDGALVTASNGKWTRRVRTDGTGFFALIDLPPGRISLSVEAKSLPAATREVNLRQGDTVVENAILGQGITKNVATLDEWNKAQPSLRVTAIVRVNVGSDTWDQHLVGTLSSGDPVSIRFAANPTFALQEGDVVAVEGYVKVAGALRWLEADACQLVDMQPGRTVRLTLAGAIQAHSEPRDTQLATMIGHVSESDSEGFWLNGEQRVWVEAGSRKGVGVEDAAKELVTPPPGRSVRVTGVLLKSQAASGEAAYVLVPLYVSDIVEMSPGIADRWRLSVILLLTVAGFTGAFIYWRVRRQSQLGRP
jgi:uncharacterized lipoprotein YddW (UPF0748 family)